MQRYTFKNTFAHLNKLNTFRIVYYSFLKFTGSVTLSVVDRTNFLSITLLKRFQIKKLRATIHRDAGLISKEACHLLGLDITKTAMDLISELVYKKLTLYGSDLEAFAKHAKRQTINADDVKLLLRRNPALLAETKKAVQNTTSNTKEKRRKTVALPVVMQPETPNQKPRETTEKSPVAEKPLESEDVIERMMVDETIDLTFD